LSIWSAGRVSVCYFCDLTTHDLGISQIMATLGGSFDDG
jgi:hypothetical protein